MAKIAKRKKKLPIKGIRPCALSSEKWNTYKSTSSQNIRSKLSNSHENDLKNFEELSFQNQKLENVTITQEKPPKCTWKSFNKNECSEIISSLLNPSVFVKFESKMNETDWRTLKCFEGIISDEKNLTFFTGGPVSSSAFCPTKNASYNQYVALAVSSISFWKQSVACTKPKRGLIQIWNVGPLHLSNFNFPPKMEFAIHHKHGTVLDMRWCPDSSLLVESEVPSKLGLLSVACSDGSVRVYDIPHPASMNVTLEAPPLFHCNPSIVLDPLYGGPCSSATKSACTCLSWQESGMCDRIAGGYGNGMLFVWFIKYPNHLETKPVTIQPYIALNAHLSPIASVSFSPLDGSRWLITSGLDATLKCFDLLDTSIPFHVAKNNTSCKLKWSDWVCGAIMGLRDCVSDKGSVFFEEFGTENFSLQSVLSPFPIMSVSALSDSSNAQALSDLRGTVSVNLLDHFYARRMRFAISQSYRIFETKVVPLSECNNLPEVFATSHLQVPDNNRLTLSTNRQEGKESTMKKCSCCAISESKTTMKSTALDLSTSQKFNGYKSNPVYEDTINFQKVKEEQFDNVCRNKRKVPIVIPLNILDPLRPFDSNPKPIVPDNNLTKFKSLKVKKRKQILDLNNNEYFRKSNLKAFNADVLDLSVTKKHSIDDDSNSAETIAYDFQDSQSDCSSVTDLYDWSEYMGLYSTSTEISDSASETIDGSVPTNQNGNSCSDSKAVANSDNSLELSNSCRTAVADPQLSSYKINHSDDFNTLLKSKSLPVVDDSSSVSSKTVIDSEKCQELSSRNSSVKNFQLSSPVKKNSVDFESLVQSKSPIVDSSLNELTEINSENIMQRLKHLKIPSGNSNSTESGNPQQEISAFWNSELPLSASSKNDSKIINWLKEQPLPSHFFPFNGNDFPFNELNPSFSNEGSEGPYSDMPRVEESSTCEPLSVASTLAEEENSKDELDASNTKNCDVSDSGEELECPCSLGKNLSYKMSTAKYGIIFKDINKAVKTASMNETPENVLEFLPDERDLLPTITTLSWNPNKNCQFWLLAAGNSGIARLFHIPEKKVSPKRKR